VTPASWKVYLKASKELGVSTEKLRERGIDIFASILHHAMQRPRKTVWTVATISDHKLGLEVNMPPRRPAIRKGQRACRKCFCTEDHACWDKRLDCPCMWAGVDICTNCLSDKEFAQWANKNLQEVA
jgi:hypothetical protein